jgi:nitrite reductase/ring-hydroxylating ferredoxin subunit
MNGQDPEQLTIPPDGRPEAEQPRWRQDFPIDWPQDNYISRRDFTKFMLLVSLAFTVGQLWILAQNFFRRQRGELPIREIARLDEIPVGGSLLFNYPEEHAPRIMVRLAEQSFVAYDQLCTHLSCPVIPQPEVGYLHCPCHEGLFDLATGQPLAGPPRRPLPRIRLEIRGDKIYATGVEEAFA